MTVCEGVQAFTHDTLQGTLCCIWDIAADIFHMVIKAHYAQLWPNVMAYDNSLVIHHSTSAAQVVLVHTTV